MKFAFSLSFSLCISQKEEVLGGKRKRRKGERGGEGLSWDAGKEEVLSRLWMVEEVGGDLSGEGGVSEKR